MFLLGHKGAVGNRLKSQNTFLGQTKGNDYKNFVINYLVSLIYKLIFNNLYSNEKTF